MGGTFWVKCLPRVYVAPTVDVYGDGREYSRTGGISRAGAVRISAVRHRDPHAPPSRAEDGGAGQHDGGGGGAVVPGGVAGAELVVCGRPDCDGDR